MLLRQNLCCCCKDEAGDADDDTTFHHLTLNINCCASHNTNYATTTTDGDIEAKEGSDEDDVNREKTAEDLLRPQSPCCVRQRGQSGGSLRSE